MEIAILKKQGKSIREISRLMGVSRNTVRRYLRNKNAAQRTQANIKTASKLDPYKEYIQRRLQSALPDRIPSTVVLREIVEQGYEGRYSLLSHYISGLGLHKKTAEQLQRFETEPGKQMQADWATMRSGRSPIYAFVATLGFSRASYVEFSSTLEYASFQRC